jgi:HK97 family phage major capsid protein
VEDYHFVWGAGTGVGQPLGIMHAGATIAHARANNAGTPIIADLAEMAERLLPGSWATAIWMMNPNVIGGLSQDAAAGSNTGAILDLADMLCMGRPIILTEKCAAAGATGDVILADWNHYVIGNRSLEISASREVPGSYGFLTDETFWRVVLRVDGQPIMDAPVTPRFGADTLSAFVILTTSS